MDKKKTEYAKRWKAANKEKVRGYARDYRNRNKKRIADERRKSGYYKKIYKRKYERLKERGFYLSPQWKYFKYKVDARKRGLEFALSKEKFYSLCNKNCFYCGVLVCVGIDRVDNSIGYVEGNIVTSCKDCNVAKMKMTVSEFIGMCKRVATIHKHISGSPQG